jgi:hypothetical protein
MSNQEINEYIVLENFNLITNGISFLPGRVSISNAKEKELSLPDKTRLEIYFNFDIRRISSTEL